MLDLADWLARANDDSRLNAGFRHGVLGGSIVVPHLRRAYELLEEMYG